jgi:uncharacterized membrane protein YtjA (UPF0391 family)
MLGRALVFFMLAVMAASLFFGGLTGLAATTAKILCVAFLSFSVISLLMKAMRGPTPRVRPR